jgi:hypothetical protein
MKTLPLVMVLLLLPLLGAFADADQQVTVVGTDETMMGMPEPWMPDLVDTPRPDAVLIPAPEEPLVLPPPPAPPGDAVSSPADQK